MSYSPDGKILATGSDDTDERLTIKLWDPATGQLIRGWNGGEERWLRWRFRPTVESWPPATSRTATTFGSGMFRPGAFGTRWRATRARSGRSLSPLTAGRSPRREGGRMNRVKTGRSGCGTSPQEAGSVSSAATPMSCARSRIRPTVELSPRPATTRRCGSGTPEPAGSCRRSATPLTWSPSRSRPTAQTLLAADDTGLITIHDAASLAVLKHDPRRKRQAAQSRHCPRRPVAGDVWQIGHDPPLGHTHRPGAADPAGAQGPGQRNCLRPRWLYLSRRAATTGKSGSGGPVPCRLDNTKARTITVFAPCDALLRRRRKSSQNP